MLLIDDSAANVITAHNAGYNALIVPGGKGFVETLKQLPLHRRRGECIHCSPLDDQTLLNLFRAPALERSSVSQGGPRNMSGDHDLVVTSSREVDGFQLKSLNSLPIGLMIETERCLSSARLSLSFFSGSSS